MGNWGKHYQQSALGGEKKEVRPVRRVPPHIHRTSRALDYCSIIDCTMAMVRRSQVAREGPDSSTAARALSLISLSPQSFRPSASTLLDCLQVVDPILIYSSTGETQDSFGVQSSIAGRVHVVPYFRLVSSATPCVPRFDHGLP